MTVHDPAHIGIYAAPRQACIMPDV